ncbi:MAG: class I SAM-dependent methyltransferase [Candidatus Cloacimonadaceae bacterium]
MTDKPVRKSRTKAPVAIDHVAYDYFAPYYDNYMRHVDYDSWTEKILSMYTQHTSRPLKDILELACGTANISERLIGKGYNVTASDRSPEMLKYAEHKVHKPNLLQAEMTDALPSHAFDLVILVFDSINYLLETAQVSTMLVNVSTALRDKGLFIFDISTHRNSAEHFNRYINIDEDKDHVLIHKADFDPELRLQKTRLTIFKRSDNHYMRMDEEHLQRVYHVQELLQFIEDSPLESVGLYSLVYDKNLLRTNTRKLDHQYSRLFFVLKKG